MTFRKRRGITGDIFRISLFFDMEESLSKMVNFIVWNFQS
jgi:hypothetical protein